MPLLAQPAFEMDDHSSAEVHTMAHPTDEDIDAMTDKELKFELRRRGFVKPPYKLWAHAEGEFCCAGRGSVHHSIAEVHTVHRRPIILFSCAQRWTQENNIIGSQHC
eukprot:SAG31_NODE_3652_length_4023_cov_12.151886_2_plen_107_part_00